MITPKRKNNKLISGINWKYLRINLHKRRLQDYAQRTNQSMFHPIEGDICDISNTFFLKIFITMYKFPHPNVLKKQGFFNFWMLLQHTYNDVSFQKRCLIMMKRFAKKNVQNIQRDIYISIAYLTDRIMVLENKNQKFGTQYKSIGDKLYILPVDCTETMKKRRHFLNLGDTASMSTLLLTKANP